MLPPFVMELAGWLPGIIFPGATARQFVKTWKEKTARGVSISTWVLFLPPLSFLTSKAARDWGLGFFPAS